MPIVMRPSAFVSQMLNGARTKYNSGGSATFTAKKGDLAQVATTAAQSDFRQTRSFPNKTLVFQMTWAGMVTNAGNFALVIVYDTTHSRQINIGVGYNGSSGRKYLWRINGTYYYGGDAAAGGSNWFKLVRSGANWGAYYSADRVNWTQIDQTRADAAATALNILYAPVVLRASGTPQALVQGLQWAA